MSDRPETGPMVFSDDWRGVFIRGKHAVWWGWNLRVVLDSLPERDKAIGTPGGQLAGLLSVLEKSGHHTWVETLQVMKRFDECLWTPTGLQTTRPSGAQTETDGR